ncbi:hypothetical protein [Ktedonobacter robiniae]|uniref:Uncharacterized protein n=1 Tax=Ktedonobacter robiniae TaxID=2778365 RepID=A0ABQ3UYL0_9CHLR|nr:hypothetical protein [Ktedonobacter robiniae]GHO57956.1 hypothetical protein KSB_64310 [Ktedonobacter robiniae]
MHSVERLCQKRLCDHVSQGMLAGTSSPVDPLGRLANLYREQQKNEHTTLWYQRALSDEEHHLITHPLYLIDAFFEHKL